MKEAVARLKCDIFSGIVDGITTDVKLWLGWSGQIGCI